MPNYVILNLLSPAINNKPVLTMTHPKLDDVYYAIATWCKENFRKAALLYDDVEFEFTRVYDIRKLWREHDLWVVDATLTYKLNKKDTLFTITFQINDDIEILGFDLHAPRIVPS